MTLRDDLKMSELYFIHESSFIDEQVTIGNGTRIWHFCHIQNGVSIGNDCTLGQNVYIGENVKIGNGVKIQNNVSVYNGVELEDYVFCGPSCVFTNDLTPRAKYPKGGANYLKTLVKTGASIGANATIVCNHTIGRWAFIGAGAVVVSDVPDYAIVTGVPAQVTGWVCECGKQLGGDLKCTCGRLYQKSENGLEEINAIQRFKGTVSGIKATD